MRIDVIINQLAILFFIMGIGYLIIKIKLIDIEANKLLSKLVLFVTMPCTILNTVMSGNVEATASDAFIFIAVSFVGFALFHAVAFFIPKIMRCEKKDYGIYRFAMIYGNAGFMGLPVISAILGPQSVFYLAIANIPLNCLMYTLGITLISGKASKIRLRDILNPCLVASVLILIIFLTNFKTPRIVTETTRIIGGMTTPGAMLAIGATLATIPFREVVTKWRLYITAAMKLLIIPAVTWLVFKPFVSNTLILNVLVLVTAMPTAANAALLVLEFGGDEKLGSSLVFITTLLSAVTIPIVTLLFIII